MTTSRVRQQYEALPYPPRNPADEKQRLVRTVGDGVMPIGRMIVKVKPSAGGGNPQAIRADLGRAFDLLHDMGWAYLCNAPGDKVS